ncbi:MAG: hypothetical protein JWO38_4851 [Gemmataceae bacterium]|nr:hypothetical protein [Gemmataceae bacterium]
MSTAPTDRPAPPPGLVPPAYPSPSTQLEPPLPPPPPPPSIPAGYTHSWAITISPRVMAWVPAAALTLIFFLTMLPWVGSYVGGQAVYTQNPWRAAFGGPKTKVWRNFDLEKLLKSQSAWPEGVLDKVQADRELMIPYILVLLLAMVFAWAERVVASLDRTRLPRQFQWVASIWPYRVQITAGLATIALLLVLIQSANGFGLERAMRQAASEKFAAARKAAEQKAAEGSPSDLAAVNYEEEEEYARYNLQRTTWMYLAIALHILVVVAMVVRAWLERRGNRPPPRIVFQY